jgi:hypothetical protein
LGQKIKGTAFLKNGIEVKQEFGGKRHQELKPAP